jgi:restriction endonuclease S subunit
MAKKYIDNHKLNIAIELLMNSLDYTEKYSIHDVIKLESGDYLPKHQMQDGIYPVYGGGGKTENNHNEFNIDFETIGIGRVGARCGCVFSIEKESWVTDNALYVKEYDKRFTLKFLKHFLNYSNLNKYANDSMQPVISKTGIQSVEIPLLSFEKQVELGEFLDELERNNFNRLNDYPIIKDKINILDKIENFQIEKQTRLISQLSQSILQEAIQGKLTTEWREQNPNTKPTIELLKRIKKEREQLVKENKREKHISPISTDEIPFELPQGWVWCRLCEIIDFQIGKTPTTKDYDYWENGTYNWLSISDMEHLGEISKTSKKITQKAVDDIMKNQIITPIDTILMSFKLTVGKISINKIPLYHNEAIVSIFPSNVIEKKYLYYLLTPVLEFSKSKSVLMGQTFNSNSLSNILFPLPPLFEQQAIISKIENLLEKCNQLQEEIENINKNSKRLLKALYNETF